MKNKEITAKINQMAEAITGRLEIKELVQTAVTVCKDVMGADACSIFLIEENKPGRLIMKASCGYRNDLSNKAVYWFRKDKPNKKLGVTGWIASTGKTFKTKSRVEFSRKCPEHLGKYDKQLHGGKNKTKTQSFFGAPLRKWDRILGVLKVESFHTDAFSKEDEDTLQIIALMITSSLQHLKRIELFHSIFEEIGTSPAETEKLYGSLARKCVELVHAEACSIFIPNEKGRLVLRGDYGHEIPLVDMEGDEYTYAPGEGVTGTVFLKGQPSIARSKEDVENNTSRENKLYPKQWREKHECHSWYQFPVGKGFPLLGVMKIENKLGINETPIEKGGFSESEKHILEILTNSVVPLIIIKKTQASERHALSILDSFGYTTNIDEIFSPDLLQQIENLETVRNRRLHNKVLSFIKEVKNQRKVKKSNYLEIAKRHINQLGRELGLSTDFLKYSEALAHFEEMLFQLPKYRAHFVHQLNVFLNGYLILNWLNDAQFKFIKETIAKKNRPPTKEIDLFKIWLITAIFHDTGYPIGKVANLTQNFLERIFNSKFDNIAAPIREILSFRLFRGSFREALHSLLKYLFTTLDINESREKNISHKIHELYFKVLNENLAAALFLIKASEKLENKDIYMLGTILSAIILEDEEICKILQEEDVQEILYENHPIAFLLMYCDNIQEYGRPKSVYKKELLEGAFKLPAIDAFAVRRQEFPPYDGKNICCNLVYKDKPPRWVKDVRPKIERLKDFWKSRQDLIFVISYQNDCGEFENLKFKFAKTQNKLS